MAKKIFSQKILIGALLALSFITALFFRIYFPWDTVFGGEVIKYTGVDAYYQMRMVENLAFNLPHVPIIDPYFIYPTAISELSFNFFHWLLAGTIWIVGLGSPSQHLVDVIGVYFPVILAALTVIPVYFIGKELFNRWAGIIAAGLVAIMPGEFIGRSILGFTDYHIAETLLTTSAMLFLILAVKTARQRELKFGHLKRQYWSTSARPVVYSLLAGVFLGLYLLTWQGALLFVLIFSIYFIIQSIIDHLRHRSTDYLCIVGVVVFVVALIFFAPASPSTLHLVSVVIALLIPVVLGGVSRLMAVKNTKPFYYPVILAVTGLAGIGIFYLINPALINAIFDAMGSLFPKGASLTTIEMQPLLRPGNQWTLTLAWGNFSTGFYLSIICFGVLIYNAIKHDDAVNNLLLIWSLVIMVITFFLQRRFAYYYAVNVALLTGYLSCYILKKTIFKETPAESGSRPTGRATRSRSQIGGLPITINHVVTAITVIIVIVVVFAWNIEPAVTTASRAQFAPSDAWVSSLTWLRDNTPEPLGDPNAYYARHKAPPPGESYRYPESVYGVLAWWDYGYWITSIGHRIPNANPSQHREALTSVASFFTAQDESTAEEIIGELDSLYIIIDYETAHSKFYAVALWAGSEMSEFFDYYWLPTEQGLQPIQLYHPEYYRSMVSRLYNFDGQAVSAAYPVVISYDEMTDPEGVTHKILTSVEEFTSYQEAESYLASQETGNFLIVGTNPYVSPVTLEPLENYQPVYSSDIHLWVSENMTLPAVKIFEYLE